MIDPWSFTLSVGLDFPYEAFLKHGIGQVRRSVPSEGLNLQMSSRERLDVNLSAAFAELVATTWKMWGKEGDRVLQRARGSYAPYRIWNRTGYPISVWAAPDANPSNKRSARVPSRTKIAHGQIVDWRFGDWQTQREVSVVLSTAYCYSNIPVSTFHQTKIILELGSKINRGTSYVSLSIERGSVSFPCKEPIDIHIDFCARSKLKTP